MHKRPKILKLGWEFPPLLTGGLGTACYGLAKALSKYADLTVIIPHCDAGFKVSKFKLIGLNELHFRDASFDTDQIEELLNNEPAHDYREFAEVREVFMDLNPYPSFSVAVGSDFDFSDPEKIDTNFLKSAGLQLPPSYLRNTAYNRKLNRIHGRQALSIHAAEAEALFNDTDAYGPNIMRKVAAYTEVVCSIARRMEFDIIHAHDWITFSAAMLIKKESGKPLVVHLHSLETDRVGVFARNEVYYLELEAMKAADRVFPVSNFTRSQIISNYGIDAAKINTVYNGIEPVNPFHSTKPENEKWILFLGRVTRQKGPFMILETARKLLKRMPNVRFYVAGAGDQLGHLQHAVEKEGLSNFFVFTGFLNKSQVARLLSQADVYFMPSVSEPFGLSAVEAAQFDIPCVLSKQSGVVELLINALKADFWDTDKFSDLLYGVLNFSGVRDTVVTNTRNDLKKINWETSASHVSAIYSDLLN